MHHRSQAAISTTGILVRMDHPARDTLQRIFGHAAFRGEQAEIVDHVVAGGDALVLMPTGGGKSLCYQMPALLRDGTGIVVSPLIALMQDQVEALRQLGVRAAFLNSTLDGQHQRAGRAGAARRRARPALRRARAAADAALPVAARTQPDRAVRDRRGALRLAMGPRLPPRIPRADDPARALAAGAAHRADRDRRPADAARDRRAPAARGGAPLRQLVRPAQHPLHRRAEGQRRAAAARFPRRASRRGRHRLLPVAQEGREDRRSAGRARRHRPALSRRAGCRSPRRRTSAASCARTAWSWWRRSRSAWASTSPTCASSRIWTCPSRSRATTRKPAAPAATASPPKPGSATASATSCLLKQMIENSEAGEERKRLERRKLDALLGYCETTRCRRQVLLANFGEEYPTAPAATATTACSRPRPGTRPSPRRRR